MVRIALAISLIIEGTSLFLYADILWGIDKEERKKVFLWYLIGYIVIFSLHSFDSVLVILRNFGMYTLINILLLKFVHRLTWGKAICHAAAISFFSTLAELITGSVINMFVQYWENWQEDYNLVGMAFSNILFFLMVLSLALLQKNYKKIHVENLAITLTFAVPFSVIEVIFILMLAKGEVTGKGIMVCAALLAIGMLFILFVYGYMERLRRESEKVKQQLQLNKDNARYVDDMMRRDEKQRLLIHDIKNHLRTIESLCGDTADAAADYIAKLLASPALRKDATYSDSKALNAILYRYACEAKELEIAYDVNCNRANWNFLNNYELSTLFCNILDNALEAAQKVEHAFVEVQISYIPDKRLLVIRVVNSCNDNLKYDRGHLQTTKREKRYHGYGLRSVEETLKPHKATMELYYDRQDSTFHTVIVFSEVQDENCDM